MIFSERYGPWALIAGASEGTGREFARQIAVQGVRCLLVGRRAAPLAELVEAILAESGIECDQAVVDLAAPDAFAMLKAAAGDREIGLYVANAGADPNGARFHDRDVETWLALVRRNVMTMVEACHYFGGRMKQRSRGGMLLVNSGACYGGASFMTTYAATKAFELAFAEGLWAELRPHGVDVLSFVMGQTDTPAFRTMLAEKGLSLPEGAASAVEVAAQALTKLSQGPVQNWGVDESDVGWAPMSASARRKRTEMIDHASRRVFGAD